MNTEQKFCKTCLTKLGEDDYCEICTDKPEETINQEDFPAEYFWYGIIAALIFGFASYFIVYTLFGGDLQMKKMGVALFFIVPLCSGATLGYFARPINNLMLRT